MAVKKDILQTILQLDSNQAINKLGQLEMEYNDIRRSLKGLKKDHKDYANLVANEKKAKAALEAQRKELGLQGMTLTQLIRYERELRNERSRTTTKGTKEYERLGAKLREINALIRQQRLEARQLNTIWTRIGKSFQQSLSMFGPSALLTTGIYSAISAIQDFKDENIELSDVLADVQKNTDMTAQEVDQLLERLMKFDTKSTRKELLELSIVAGKLGILGVQQIEGFVNAADKINVALGEDLGDVNEVMKELGKLVNVFKIDELYDVEESLLKTGSAINDLGRSSVAQEKNIVEFTRRMGGVAPVAKVSIQDIMGLGAAGDSLGLSMEVMGTAMSQVFTKMVSNRSKYAQFAKDTEGNSLSVEDFTELINTDFNDALISVLRGLRGNEGATTEFVSSLGDLGLEGQRVIQVFSALALGVDDVVTQQQIANDSFAKGTSIMEEFALKNETAGANLSKVWKVVSNQFVNSGVVRYFEDLTARLAALIPPADTAVDRMENMRYEMNLELNALKNLNVSTEKRREIIARLNEKYGNYLPSLISEKDSIAEISEKQEHANRQYLAKILLMQREAEITALLKAQYTAQEQLWNLEKDQQQLRSESYKMDSQEYETRTAQLEKVKELHQHTIDQANRDLEESEKKFEALAARMGTTIDDLMNGINRTGTAPPTPTPTNTSTSKPTKKELEEYERFVEKIKELRNDLDIALLDSEQQEVAQVERKYEALMNEAYSFYQRGIISEKEYKDTIVTLNEEMNDELDQLFSDRNKRYAEERKRLQEEIGLSLLGEEDKEIAQVTAHYDALIAEAKKFNLSIVALEKAKAAAIDAIRDDYRQKEVESNRELYAQIANDISSSLSSIAAIQNEQTEQGIKNQQLLANAAIIASNAVVLANQASALSAAIKGASEAAAATGPLAPLTIIGYIASMTATVLSAFAGIRANNQAAKEAISDLNSDKQNTDTKAPSHYYGGETGYESIGKGDAYGPFTGYTHAGELVVPNYVRSDPQVIDAEKVIKARMQGYTLGGTQQVNTTSTLDAGEFRQGVALFKMAVDVLTKNGVPSYFTPREYERAQENNDKKTAARNRGSLQS